MKRSRDATVIQAGMTPLIDVVFLLIVFFVLVSRIVDEDRPRLDLPAPTPPATIVPGPGPRAVVSLVPGPDDGPSVVRLAGLVYPPSPQGRADLSRAIAAMLSRDATTAVQVRADRTAAWEDVSPILDAARAAGRLAALATPVRVQLAAVREHGP